MIKRKLSMLLLLPSLLMTSCNNTTKTELVESYTTENIIITDSEDALDRLKKGNKRFLKDESQLINVTSDRRSQLEDGQNPYAVIVSCSDSRVTPSLIFNCGLGEIFDVRIAGNVLDKNALGSIEYAVEHLNCPLLVIMGHEKCGAVSAAYDKLKNGTEVEENINSIVDKILPHIHNSDDLENAIKENIDSVYDEVKEDVIVKKFMKEGKLKVVKAYYSLDGKVDFD